MADLRVTHVITGLDTGGAEMMLLKLARASQGRLHHTVISLTGRGSQGSRIEEAGGTLVTLELKGALQSLLALPRLGEEIRRAKPDVVQGWMYHGNIASSLATMLTAIRKPVAWSVRCTIGNFRDEISATRPIFLVTRVLSHRPQSVIYNSDLARREHEAAGYPARDSIVIPNGFDLNRFKPDSQAREVMRRKLGVANDQILFGLLARLHAMKDPGNFVAAATQVAREVPHAMFVMAGRNMPALGEQMPELRDMIATLGPRLILLPELADVRPLLNALDVFALTSSYGEGFSNALGEAMAMGLPAIATDVGDCRLVLDDCGISIPPRLSDRTADAMRQMAALDSANRRLLGEKARAHILMEYSIQTVATRYESVWKTLAGRA